MCTNPFKEPAGYWRSCRKRKKEIRLPAIRKSRRTNVNMKKGNGPNTYCETLLPGLVSVLIQAAPVSSSAERMAFPWTR